MAQSDILDRIVAVKREEVAAGRARTDLAGDQEELVIDAGDHEGAALRGLRAQRGEQHTEIAEHCRWQRRTPPLPAVTVGRDRESAFCHIPPSVRASAGTDPDTSGGAVSSPYPPPDSVP